MIVSGMVGIGDNLHQRAVLRDLMKQGEVWLETPYAAMFHDLADQGLRIVPTRRQISRMRETTQAVPVAPPRAAKRLKVTYDSHQTLKHNSVLAAQFASCGLQMPERPDFSLPVKPQWRDNAKRLMASWPMNGKPLMVYRPIVQNDFWSAPARSPDPRAYQVLYDSIRPAFFVVSIADLKKKGNGARHGEWIVGPRADADVELHNGELDFETMAGLFAEAALVFGNAGFTPIMAQAIGAPAITVYGGNEGFEETNRSGSHLAPTLPIEPIKPCRCHLRFHDCDKTIDLDAALPKVRAFALEHGGDECHLTASQDKPRVLIFGTTYADTPERAKLTQHWVRLHKAINPDCDFLLVDSASPQRVEGVEVFCFPDNIGHLSRGGRDGWGRAFCKGLEIALERGYDYAVHIEGDSLCRLNVMPIVRRMQADGVDVASVPVGGTRRQEVGWVETGLMFFRVGYLTESDFIAQYDWPNRQVRPTPEKVIFGLLAERLRMMPWRAERADKSQITVDNVAALDWVTHCHDAPQVYDRFVDEVLGVDTMAQAAAEMVKVNLGCGKNKIPGWRNHDIDVDITQPLPFESNSVDFILAEHCTEHVDYYKAIEFLKECSRVLKPWGVLRIVVPAIDLIRERADAEYFRFVKRWAPTEDLRGAMHAILYEHGHRTAWTQSLMEATLFYCGFKHMVRCEPLQSRHLPLRDVDGHPKVIGKRNNWIESLVMEAEAEK